MNPFAPNFFRSFTATLYLAIPLAGALLLVAQLGQATPLPPPETPDEFKGTATLRFKAVTHLTLGPFKVKFEETRLQDVIAAAKMGRIDHKGDGGGSVYWVCFNQRSASHTDRIWLTSSVMGGPEHAVTEVVAERLPSAVAKETGCPDLPRALSPVTLDRGVWLGASKGTITRKFGQPSFIDGPWQTFYFEAVLPLRYREPGTDRARMENADVANILAVDLQHGKVTRLRALQVTSF